jgi:hypothetical protein
MSTITNRTVITVTSLILIGGLVCAALAADGWIENKAKNELQRHCDRDVDKAHSDLPKRYVPRTEVQRRLGSIDSKLERLTETVNERLPNIRTWIGRQPVPGPRRHRRAAGRRTP